MSVNITAVLPLPPSINRTYGTTKGGTFFKHKVVKDWQADAEERLREAGLSAMPEGDYRMSVDYRVFCSDRRDIDSGLKVTLDSIENVCGVNDNNVLALTCTKVPTKTRAKHHLVVRVSIEPK